MDGAINVLSAQELSWKRLENVHELKESLVAILWSSGTTGLPKGTTIPIPKETSAKAHLQVSRCLIRISYPKLT